MMPHRHAPNGALTSRPPREGTPCSGHPIEIRRSRASFAFGSVSVSTPSSSCALIFS